MFETTCLIVAALCLLVGLYGLRYETNPARHGARFLEAPLMICGFGVALGLVGLGIL